MRALAQTLEEIPGNAWESELGPAPRRAMPSRSGAGPVPRRGAWARAVTGAAATAGLAGAFLVGALTHPWTRVSPAGGGAGGPHVVLTPVNAPAGGGRAVAYMLGNGGRMRLRIEHLPPSPPGTYYELWLMTSTTHLVSVSSFRVGADGSGVLNLILPDNPSAYRYLDISVQHVGRGAAISQQSVLRGVIPA